MACDGMRWHALHTILLLVFLHPAAASAGRACGAATKRTRPSTAATSRPLRDRDQVLVANVATLIMRAEQLHVQIANGADEDVAPRASRPGIQRRHDAVPCCRSAATKVSGLRS
jgi:hypothetical protein